MPDSLMDPTKRFAAMACILLWIIMLPVGLIAYWQFIDTTPPVEQIDGKFVGWDATHPRRGWVEWSAVHNRSCPGTAYRWLVNGVIAELTPMNIPYAGNVGALNDGRVVWHTPFEVPDYYRHSAMHRVRIEYACNPWQHLVPLIVPVPDVAIPLPPGIPARPAPPAPQPQTEPPDVIPPEDANTIRRRN